MTMATIDLPSLDGLRVLLVEDNFLIADDIEQELREAGCRIIGPAPRVERGLALATTEPLDGALLDVNLSGEMCFPIADVLIERGIPFMFLTGYGEAAVPPAYRAMPRLSKPFDHRDLLRLVKRHFRKRG